jgi:hypothetical protein
VTFGRHNTFYLREGWVYKIITEISEDALIFSKNEAPLVFGVGKNMVPALKFWGEALGIIKKQYNKKNKKHEFLLTEIGKKIKEFDLYLENKNTLWLLHTNLVKHKLFASTWYWIFNEYTTSSIKQSDFPDLIKTWVEPIYTELGLNSPKIAGKTLEKDIACFVQTYTKTNNHKDPENNLISPLAILGLVSKINGRIFLNSLKTQEIPLEIFEFVLMDYLKENTDDAVSGVYTKDIKHLLQDPGSPGKVLRCSTNTLYELIVETQKRNIFDKINITRTAGLDQLYLSFTKDSYNELLSSIIEGKVSK